MSIVIKEPMKFLIFCSLFSFSLWCCELKKDYDYISLAGSTTMLLQEMNLLSDPALKIISKFHPISKPFRGEILNGGIFLSNKFLEKYKNKIIFFDQSYDLRKNLNNLKYKRLIEVITRKKSSMETAQESIALISPYLISCELEIKKVNEYLEKVKNQIVELPLLKGSFLFYLGDAQLISAKSYLMLNDGWILDLLKSKKIISYSSGQAYVLPSQKKLQNLNKPLFEIGLVEGFNQGLRLQKDTRWNFEFPGVLTPGISQVKALESFLGFYKLLY